MSERDLVTIVPPPALTYLLPRSPSFWRWAHDGRTIDWTDGHTIAFREEVQSVLARLAPRGLPPFGSVVLLLAATRDTWGDGARNAEQIIRQAHREVGRDSAVSSPGTQLVLSFLMPQALQQEVREACDELSVIAALPPELRRTMRARHALAELVFDGAAHRGSVENANAVVELLRSGIDADTLRAHAAEPKDDGPLVRELETLRSGLARVAVEPLSAFMRTGVDTTVRAPQLELAAARRVRALLRDLRGDPELAGIAALAQNLLAAVHVPRALVATEEVPVGGVSDISNRGPLDRLLISELAHDDLTLAVRVALNEALYLRRESPARHPPLSRSILIDSGIRLWGVPRLFAAGIALALAASADPRAPVRTFRASGMRADEIDLTTREGLTAHLEVIEPYPHPGQSLRPWLDGLELADRGESPAGETFIVTHADVLADPEFAAALRAADTDRDWQVAVVARDGTFALWNVSRAGRREICGAKLALTDILEPKAPRTSAATSPLIKSESGLPAILSMQPFPLLLPARVDARYAAYSQRCGLVGVTTDRRLMRWTSDVKGGEQLAAALPPGRIEAVFTQDLLEAVHVVIVADKPCRVHILTAHVVDARVELRTYPRSRPRQVFFVQGLIGLAYKDEVRTIAPVTGVETVTRLSPDSRCLNGRFLIGRSDLEAFSPNAIDVVGSGDFVGAFDVQGEGPWALRRNGAIGPVAGDASAPPVNLQVGACEFRAASPDGRRLLVWVKSADSFKSGLYVVSISSNKRTWERAAQGEQAAQAQLIGDTARWSLGSSINTHWRFAGVAMGEDGTIALTPRRSTSVHGFRLHKENLHLGALPNGSWRNGLWRRVPLFQRVITPGGGRYQLRVAEWADGSRAYLDSRGMLHLVSSDAGLPQLTLTLTDRAVAGWTSNGKTFGWAHFLKAPPTSDAAYAMNLLRDFTRRLT
ncbi:MAG TPA: hypothetical protein VGR35_09725 [Tepidisphaeraceae bacterium]|nr:hypothetical protein [Tepidisphaeraceae bacterium]